MSNKAQHDNETQSDPYAGQYPPPPPLPGEHQSQESVPHEPFYLIDPISSSSSARNPMHSSHPSYEENRSNSLPVSLHSRYSYPDQSRISDSINRQANNIHTGHYFEYDDHEHEARMTAGEYYDPEAMNLKEYLEAEREEKLRKQQQQKRYSTSSSARISSSSDPQQQQQQQVMEQMVHQHPPPQPEQMYYNSNPMPPFYHQNEEPYPPNMTSPAVAMPPPMLMSPPNQAYNQPNFMIPPTLPFAHPHHQNSSNSQISNPYGGLPAGPPLPLSHPPYDDKYSSDSKRRRGGCCCGVSFCGWFRTLILCIIFFAGIGLIIASKVISDQCRTCTECQSNSICTDVFHAGFLYGGIAIAGVSVLIIVWRILKWLCAGR